MWFESWSEWRSESGGRSVKSESRSESQLESWSESEVRIGRAELEVEPDRVEGT